MSLHYVAIPIYLWTLSILLLSCSFTLFSKDACIFSNAVCAEYWRKLKINIMEKLYHQRFINLAAQIAGNEIAIFSLFHKDNKQQIIWHQNTNIYLHKVKFTSQIFEISAKTTIVFLPYEKVYVRPCYTQYTALCRSPIINSDI